ncbi:MAG: rhodanese-like domain-containing protein [Acidobacteria bacterium]|nr:rhodanese-like domain-containing protein [Acidobacteriota bacterium]
MLRVIGMLLLFVMTFATAFAITPLQQKETYPDGIPRITIEELKTKLDKKEGVVIVDVRGHAGTLIKGAINIPLADIEKSLDKLPKDKLIVMVCA